MSLDTTPPGPEPLFPTPDPPGVDLVAATGSRAPASSASRLPTTDPSTASAPDPSTVCAPDTPAGGGGGADVSPGTAATSPTSGTGTGTGTGPAPTTDPSDAVGPRVCDPDTGWDRFSVIQALTLAARREREAKIDQLILIARAAEVWSWIDNIDDVVAQIGVADRISDAATRDRVRAAAEAGDDDLLDELLTPPTDHAAFDSAAGASPGVLYGERLYLYGADGSPACSEFLRLEIGPALGIQPEAAARLIGDVLDLRHRLPGMWAHVETGRVLGWVGCQMARRTRAAGLSQELCLELDRRVSPYAPGWTPNRILTQTDKLIVILDPDTAEARRRDELGRRYVSFWADRHPSGAGMLHMRAQLDAVPAADLEATLNALAEVLEAVRPDLTPDARRAWGLELLADPAHAARVLAGDITGLTPPADLHTDHSADTEADDPGPETASELDDPGAGDGADPVTTPSAPAPGPSGAIEAFVTPGTPAAAEIAAVTGPATPATPDPATAPIPGGGCGCKTTGPGAGRVPTGREVSLIVHVNPADLILGAGGETPRLGHLVQTLLDQLLAEAARSGRLIVKPVLDPMAVSVSESDTPPGSMVERVQYRNPTVVFPYSDRASTSQFIDMDHTVPRPHGPTTEANLGPLDRLPHRWKTHTTCRLTQIRPGTFIWHTPAGQTFTVTPHGTYPDDPGPDWPTPPHSGPRSNRPQTSSPAPDRPSNAPTRPNPPDPPAPVGPAQHPPNPQTRNHHRSDPQH
ncbi:DUF222 domain-containing protein [Ammonicoccus fulvus]|uniref:DUF222 domain-containing protein n=1 Tax=Ammonicoccus fulvus TaxID=3138240 RepID=A0ABZ3FSK3_9ACTN